MDKVLIEKPLEEKELYSKKVVQETYERYGRDVGVAFSGGKDSTVLLHLVRSVFDGRIPWKVFTLDTSAEFKEIKDFVHKVTDEWNLELIVLKNEEAIKKIEIAKDKVECCYLLKVVPINNAIKDYGLKALLTAVRWDEQEARINEEFFTQRENPPHMRVQPILHFREIDIWSYIKKYNIPYCELYKKGYRSIDCEPCTRLCGTDWTERSGRAPEKEKVMKRLKEMGYF
ncbi:phosphoadenosine phosphosulfate reductase family protein [Thermodesulfovibrio sp. 3462-1]|uniref:Phosphoadenosine phosphosulfate reductase family protein n=1 Tax=Thermodesulfovibrio obliviosus TaxID=3118332 RepID=A0AAU8H6B4_9BACT